MDKVLASQRGFCNFKETKVVTRYPEMLLISYCTLERGHVHARPMCFREMQSCFKFSSREGCGSLWQNPQEPEGQEQLLLCTHHCLGGKKAPPLLTPTSCPQQNQCNSQTSSLEWASSCLEGPARSQSLTPRGKGFRKLHVIEGHLPCLPPDCVLTTLSLWTVPLGWLRTFPGTGC